MHSEDILIEKILKKGKYYYITFSDGINVKFDPEIYYSYSLKEGCNFDPVKYSLLLEENAFKLCLNTALNLLAMRMHSTYELKTKLKQKGFSFNIVSKVIAEAINMNLLNDNHFTQNYIDELIARGQGKFKIISSLQKKGIPKDIIDNFLADMVEPEEERKRALDLMNKKLRSLSTRNLEPGKLKEKITRHLILKGFSSEIVFNLVNEKL